MTFVERSVLICRFGVWKCVDLFYFAFVDVWKCRGTYVSVDVRVELWMVLVCKCV